MVAPVAAPIDYEPETAHFELAQANIDNEVIHISHQPAEGPVFATELVAFSSPSKPVVSPDSRCNFVASGPKPVRVNAVAHLTFRVLAPDGSNGSIFVTE